jgi:hypothetical protein
MNRPAPLPKIHTNCASLRLFAPNFGLFIAAMGLATGCKPAAETEIAIPAAENQPVLLCGNGGHLSTELYGAIEAKLDWDENDLECTGMPRPDGKGARLRFAGLAADGEPSLAFIIGIPGLDRNTRSAEFDSNVTLIKEGDGRFFSTPDLDNCLTDIESVQPLDDSGDSYSITGTLFCLSPLPEINGDSSVSIPELRFSGLIDWGAS